MFDHDSSDKSDVVQIENNESDTKFESEDLAEKVDITEKNPWEVESIQEFSFLNCPECPFRTKAKEIFQNHAVENHPKSFILFDSKTRPKDEKLPGAKEDVIESIKETDEILKNIESPALLDFFADQVAEKVAFKIEVCISTKTEYLYDLFLYVHCTMNIDVP